MDTLLNGNVDYEFRTTLIKEFHTAEDMREIADLINGAKKYFMQKYKDNEECIAHGFSPIEKDEAEKFKTLFDGKVAKIGLRGY